MQFVAGQCHYCGRVAARQRRPDGLLICSEAEVENSACFNLWEERVKDMFDQIANDHGK